MDSKTNKYRNGHLCYTKNNRNACLSDVEPDNRNGENLWNPITVMGKPKNCNGELSNRNGELNNCNDEPNNRSEAPVSGGRASPSLVLGASWLEANLITVMGEPNNRNDTLEANLISVMPSHYEPNNLNARHMCKTK